jgi:glycogen debranching enzyme
LIAIWPRMPFRAATYLALALSLAAPATAAGGKQAHSQQTKRTTPKGSKSKRGRSTKVRSRRRSNAIHRAAKTARSILRRNTRKVRVPGGWSGKPKRRFVVAGSGHFPDFWTRDGMFASLGALTTGEAWAARAVGDSLETLYGTQRADGLLARRIGNGSNALAMPRKLLNRFRGVENSPPSEFRTAEHTNRLPEKLGLAGPPIDSNSLAVWLTERYVSQLTASGKGRAAKAFLARNFDRIEHAVRWYDGQMQGGLLLQQKGMSDWKDTTGRRGTVLYSNALYFQSLLSFAALAEQAGHSHKARKYRDLAGKVKERINRKFWDAERGHYRDALATEADPDVFSADGNFLAVHFGIADHNQASSILRAASQAKTERFGLYKNQDRAYPGRWSRWNRLLGKEMGDYNALVIFPFHNALAALAAAKVGELETARKALDGMARAANRDGTFHETYRKEGNRPFSTKLRFGIRYASEPDFSWSAGLYLYALDRLRAAEAAQLARDRH